MTKEEIINKELNSILEEFIQNRKMINPSSDQTVSLLKEELVNTSLTLLELTPKEVFSKTMQDYMNATKEAAKLSPGFGTALEDIKNEIYLTSYLGNIGDIEQTQVTEHTRFDIASITKLYTSLEAFKLNEDGQFDINAIISEIKSSPYKTLNMSVLDAMRFKYEIQTTKRLDEKDLTLVEFYRRLLRPRITRNKYVYSDIPYIITKSLLPKMKEFFAMYQEDLNYQTLGYNTDGVITGSEDLKKVSDGKARRMIELGLEPGHAGLFGTVNDIIKVLDILSAGFLNDESIEMLLDNDTKEFYTPVYGTNNELLKYKTINHGTGVFIEHPEGLNGSQVISGLSDRAFSATGYTGSYSTFDLKNGFATCFLCNPVSIAYKEPYHLDNPIAKDSIFRTTDGDIYPPNCSVVTEFVKGQKHIHVLDSNGELIENRTQPGMMNVYKMNQFLTLYKLRFIKRVSLQLAQSDLEIEEINKRFNNGKVFKKTNQ